MIRFNFQDQITYTATYNDTSGAQKVLDLVCAYILHSCVTEVFSGRPGIDLEIRAYAVKGSRSSLPDMVIHSTSKTSFSHNVFVSFVHIFILW